MRRDRKQVLPWTSPIAKKTGVVNPMVNSGNWTKSSIIMSASRTDPLGDGTTLPTSMRPNSLLFQRRVRRRRRRRTGGLGRRRHTPFQMDSRRRRNRRGGRRVVLRCRTAWPLGIPVRPSYQKIRKAGCTAIARDCLMTRLRVRIPRKRAPPPPPMMSSIINSRTPLSPMFARTYSRCEKIGWNYSYAASFPFP